MHTSQGCPLRAASARGPAPCTPAEEHCPSDSLVFVAFRTSHSHASHKERLHCFIVSLQSLARCSKPSTEYHDFWLLWLVGALLSALRDAAFVARPPPV